MREIKFRGRRVKDNGFVYGGRCIVLRGRTLIHDEETEQDVDVNPDSVAQLLGHDSHDNEVYEGDKLTDSQGNNYIAKIDSVVEWQSNKTPVFRRVPFNFAKEFIDFTVGAKS